MVPQPARNPKTRPMMRIVPMLSSMTAGGHGRQRGVNLFVRLRYRAGVFVTG
jgi:hypothetical protein